MENKINLSESNSNNDIELLRQRFKEEQIKGGYSLNNVKNWIETMSDKGEFPGIDYTDFSKTGFSLANHLVYVRYLSRAYVDPKSTLYLDKTLRQKIDLSIQNWIDNDYQCENRWNNQLDTPRKMTSLLYILDEYLTESQKKGMLKISGAASMDVWSDRTTGNRMGLATIYAQNAIWKRDNDAIESIMKIIEDEVYFVGENQSDQYHSITITGMEKDFCFHHRNDRVDNSLVYGISYLNEFLSLALKVTDTKYRFSDRTSHQLIDFYLEGLCKHMVYCSYKDQGMLNREIGFSQSTARESVTVINQLIQIGNGYRKDELDNVIKLRKGEYLSNPKLIPSYAKFFWTTEYLAFQRPKFYTSVRMFSIRNKNMEYPYNGEGIMNHFRGDGANYISVTGREYLNLAPVYDYRKIPGATIMQNSTMPPDSEIQKNGTKIIFSGGVDDGLYGAAAFDFHSPHYDLHAKKSWFFFDDEYVCLGANITSNSSLEIFTTLEQNFLEGNVTVKNISSSQENILKNSTLNNNYSKIKWVHHNNIGYYFLNTPSQVGIMNKAVKGNWRRINLQKSIKDEVVTENVFSLWINHGKKITNQNYAYAIIPNATVNDIRTFEKNLPIKIISNSGKLQAVKHNKLDLSFAVFYEGGSLKISDDVEIKSNSSCIMMIKENSGQIKEISLSDPTRKFDFLNIGIKGRFESKNNKVNYQYKDGWTSVNFSLPKEKIYLGKSISVSNDYDNSGIGAGGIIFIIVLSLAILGLGFFLYKKYFANRFKNSIQNFNNKKEIDKENLLESGDKRLFK